MLLGFPMTFLPLVKYSTTVYWVDDDIHFLNVAVDCFQEKYNIRRSLSSSFALEFFNHYQISVNFSEFLHGCTQYEEYDFLDHLPIDIDFDGIRKIRLDNHRLNDIAVMVVDYRMSEINGIELCEQLSHLPIKKILLTGDADLQEAIDAFNKGLIHCFICKDDPNLDSVLTKNIERLTEKYFYEQTGPILYHIESDVCLPQSDPVFIDFFRYLCKEKDIQEYYLSDKRGGMILIDKNGFSIYFLIHTDKTIVDFVDMHRDNEEAIFFINNVVNRKKIPFFGLGKEMWGGEVSSWSNYFYTPNVLSGREKYYWVLIAL